MAGLPRILICDDDPLFHLAVKLAFKKGFQFFSASNGDEALALLRKTVFALVLLDIQMRTPTEGLTYIRRFKDVDSDLSIIITSGVKEFGVVRDALRLGADDYILKGVENDDLTEAVAHAVLRSVQTKNLVRCNERQSAEVFRLQQEGQSLIGISPSMQLLRRQIVKARESSANVLISGETGTGKEVVARLLRKAPPSAASNASSNASSNSSSNAAMEPFVAIDASTIQSSMAESMLFGHQRGAFTGADQSQKGIFEEADGGVVYFDEIANMPLEIQCKLLRVLEEKEIKRLGSQRVIPLEFRVICATNQNLEDLAQRGLFKEDLLQRLNVIPLTVVPLRERKEDLPGLIEHCLRRHNKGNRALSFDKEAMDCLQGYDWPGNVRELSNLVLFLLSMSENDPVTLSDLPPRMRREVGGPEVKGNPVAAPTFYTEISKFEKKILQDALLQNQGKVSRTASLLGIDRSHLYIKLKEHGLFVNRKFS